MAENFSPERAVDRGLKINSFVKAFKLAVERAGLRKQDSGSREEQAGDSDNWGEDEYEVPIQERDTKADQHIKKLEPARKLFEAYTAEKKDPYKRFSEVLGLSIDVSTRDIDAFFKLLSGEKITRADQNALMRLSFEVLRPYGRQRESIRQRGQRWGEDIPQVLELTDEDKEVVAVAEQAIINSFISGKLSQISDADQRFILASIINRLAKLEDAWPNDLKNRQNEANQDLFVGDDQHERGLFGKVKEFTTQYFAEKNIQQFLSLRDQEYAPLKKKLTDLKQEEWKFIEEAQNAYGVMQIEDQIRTKRKEVGMLEGRLDVRGREFCPFLDDFYRKLEKAITTLEKEKLKEKPDYNKHPSGAVSLDRRVTEIEKYAYTEEPGWGTHYVKTVSKLAQNPDFSIFDASFTPWIAVSKEEKAKQKEEIQLIIAKAEQKLEQKKGELAKGGVGKNYEKGINELVEAIQTLKEFLNFRPAHRLQELKRELTDLEGQLKSAQEPVAELQAELDKVYAAAEATVHPIIDKWEKSGLARDAKILADPKDLLKTKEEMIDVITAFEQITRKSANSMSDLLYLIKTSLFIRDKSLSEILDKSSARFYDYYNGYIETGVYDFKQDEFSLSEDSVPSSRRLHYNLPVLRIAYMFNKYFEAQQGSVTFSSLWKES